MTGFDRNETKLPTYWSTPFTNMCLGMRVGNTTKFLEVNFNKAKSLYYYIADGVYKSVPVKWEQWKQLVENASIQTLCQRYGFNVKADNLNNSTQRAFAKVYIFIHLKYEHIS